MRLQALPAPPSPHRRKKNDFSSEQPSPRCFFSARPSSVAPRLLEFRPSSSRQSSIFSILSRIATLLIVALTRATRQLRERQGARSDSNATGRREQPTGEKVQHRLTRCSIECSR